MNLFLKNLLTLPSIKLIQAVNGDQLLPSPRAGSFKSDLRALLMSLVVAAVLTVAGGVFAADTVEIAPKSGATYSNTWVWDGKELKPKQGATYSNTWLWDGKEFKPKQGATYSNTWVWDGREFKPKQGATYSNTWVWDGKELKPKQDATYFNTWSFTGGAPVPVMMAVALRL